MSVTRPPIPPADERYKDAIDELRKVLVDGKAFAAASGWAIEQCRKAKEHKWSVSNRFEETWEGASAAAHKLAGHLESGGWFGAQRITQAEKQIGMSLRFESKKPDDPINAAKTPARAKMEQHKVTAAMFPSLLRALSKQPVPQRPRPFRGRTRYTYAGETQFVYGPLMFFGTDERTKRPSRTTTLALALTHGFRVISEAGDDSMCRLRLNASCGFKRRGGKPCYAAAIEFANATFQDDKKTSVEAITKYLSRRGWDLRFWGFSN